MKYRQFSDLGWKVSEIGIGCWAIGSEWGDVSVEDAKEALYTSILIMELIFLIQQMYMEMAEVKKLLKRY